MIQELVARLRPMTYLGFAFTDVVNGKPVNYYRDALGRRWLAEGRWAWFRVPAGRQDWHDKEETQDYD